MTDQPQAAAPATTLIMTVFNEADSIRGVLESFVAQTRQPDEIVIVDAGSTDDTVQIISEFRDVLPLQVFGSLGANISEGRNIAINKAQGGIIAATDAGTRLPPNWFEAITAPFMDPEIDVTAGFFRADPQTPFEVAMGATVLPLEDEIDPATFLPSSRSVAFRKNAWASVGGYPEWIDYCEDLIYDINLQTRYAPFGWAPDACVAFRPRTSIRAFWKQYYLYARGDGKANLWRKRHAIRYATYLIGAPVIVALGISRSPLWLGLFAAGGFVYLRQPYHRLNTVWHWYRGDKQPVILDKLKSICWVPVIRVLGDIAKMAGYPVGILWRIRHKPAEWRIERQEDPPEPSSPRQNGTNKTKE